MVVFVQSTNYYLMGDIDMVEFSEVIRKNLPWRERPLLAKFKPLACVIMVVGLILEVIGVGFYRHLVSHPVLLPLFALVLLSIGAKDYTMITRPVKFVLTDCDMKIYRQDDTEIYGLPYAGWVRFSVSDKCHTVRIEGDGLNEVLNLKFTDSSYERFVDFILRCTHWQVKKVG